MNLWAKKKYWRLHFLPPFFYPSTLVFEFVSVGWETSSGINSQHLLPPNAKFATCALQCASLVAHYQAGSHDSGTAAPQKQPRTNVDELHFVSLKESQPSKMSSPATFFSRRNETGYIWAHRWETNSCCKKMFFSWSTEFVNFICHSCWTFVLLNFWGGLIDQHICFLNKKKK